MNRFESFKRHRNDFFLISGILVLAIIVFLIFRISLTEGNRVSVLVDGEKIHGFTLDKDHKETVKTQYGENVVVIKNGEVSVIDADCPDKICVNHRAISKTGETIVCLPHKLVVEIENGGE